MLRYMTAGAYVLCLSTTSIAAQPLWVSSTSIIGSPTEFFLASSQDASLTFLGEASEPLALTAIDFGPNGILWAATTTQLEQIDPTTLEVSSFGVLGGSATGMAVAAGPDGSFVLGVQRRFDNLLSNIFAFDTTTADIFAVTDLPINVPAVDYRADGQLIGVEDDNASVWAIDPFTGDVDLLGQIDGLEGMVTDISLSATAGYINTYDDGAGRLYSFDPFTLEQSFIGAYPAGSVITGIAIVPAPAPLVVFPLAAATLFPRRRSGKAPG